MTRIAGIYTDLYFSKAEKYLPSKQLRPDGFYGNVNVFQTEKTMFRLNNGARMLSVCLLAAKNVSLQQHGGYLL